LGGKEGLKCLNELRSTAGNTYKLYLKKLVTATASITCETEPTKGRAPRGEGERVNLSLYGHAPGGTIRPLISLGVWHNSIV